MEMKKIKYFLLKKLMECQTSVDISLVFASLDYCPSISVTIFLAV